MQIMTTRPMGQIKTSLTSSGRTASASSPLTLTSVSDQVNIRFGANAQHLNRQLVELLNPKNAPTLDDVKTLLEQGANPNAWEMLWSEANGNGTRVSNSMTTPFLESIKLGNRDIVALLIQHGAKVNDDSQQRPRMIGDSIPLVKAAELNKPELIQLLIDNQANLEGESTNNRTALDIAATKGNLESVQLLLQAKANVNHKNYFGRTPLHEVCSLAPSRLNPGEYNPKAVQGVIHALIQAGAKMNIKDTLGNEFDSGLTPLGVAVSSGNLAAVEALLTYKPNLNKTDASGRTLLDLVEANKWVDKYGPGDTMEKMATLLKANGARKGIPFAPKRLAHKVARGLGHTFMFIYSLIRGKGPIG